ncbi:MAG TPA: hypothetical protein VMH05_08360 [Bryobacteraceae bacterium]|nr:hypothetical protein [Bryobacteraceae bacterium]
MKQNLDGLKAEIEQHLEQAGMTVFYSHARSLDSAPAVFWDCQQHPDYREFIQAAKAADVKLVVFHQHEFTAEQIDDALDQLHECDLPREDYRDFERRLKEARAYEGFVCEIELSFTHQGSVFVFDLRTDWYRELTEVLGEIEVLTGMDDDDEDSSLGGYFSKN